MIVFLSDIHISDSTAGPHNISEGAYSGTFKNLNEMATDAGAEEVIVVLLGDIVDLIRSNRWYLEKDHSRKPWGGGTGEAIANKILDTILYGDRDEDVRPDPAFKYLGKFQFTNLETGKDIPTRWVYLPGNHDRLVGMFDSLRAKVKAALNFDDQLSLRPDGSFIRYFHDARHGVFARHGHEFDLYNFGGPKPFDADEWVEIPDEHYYATPIGDVIASEFASALPTVVHEKLGGKGAPPKNNVIYDRLRDVFDLRPMTALLSFLEYRIRSEENEKNRTAIVEAIRERANFMEDLPFNRNWLNTHGTMSLLDKADQLEYGMKLLKHIDLKVVEFFLPVFKHVGEEGDNFLSVAAQEYRRLDSTDAFNGVTHVLYGHTHKPDQQLVDMTDSSENARPVSTSTPVCGARPNTPERSTDLHR